MSLAGDIELDLGGDGVDGSTGDGQSRASSQLELDETRRDVAAAVRDGLLRRRKRLPAWLLYDQQGSALFEEITLLPEYYLTRTERAILTDHAAEMIRAAGPPLSVVELGAGSASKTRILLQALLAQQRHGHYTPVDVSPSALGFAQHQLRDLPRLSVRPVVARYPEELGFLRGLPGRRLVIFLGSNVGNYNPRAARTLLGAVRRQLAPGDALLMGTDLRKSAAVLLPAYDDARGVTARFNKNVLERINRVLGARFDSHRFRHVVRWNAEASRVELYLESLVAHTVPVAALDVEIPFAAGERIHTESSHKFTQAAVRALLTAAGFRWEATWRDAHRRFAVHLARVR
ncbi:MAG TPA: L-histidine N(alpha)-methyltransferase [Polyangia bacterium]|jgi:dimethylhistidine N-methyltransferase|nr:L-histidine N(alpha)-methyltransferase [Polyangia bacterium]